MTPEKVPIRATKAEVVPKNSQKYLRKWFNGLVAGMIVGGHLTACMPTEARSVIPTDTDRVVATSTYLPPQKTLESSTPTLAQTTSTTVEAQVTTTTATPESIVDPDIEAVDEVLAEQIRNSMPSMWVYDREQKQFVIRSNDDFVFSIYKRTTLRITNSNGEEIGYARYFNKNRPDSDASEYFSLTDKSENTIIPFKLYSQMGEFKTDNLTTIGKYNTKQCLFAFTNDLHVVKYNFQFPQINMDWTNKYASDTLDIVNGDELVQAGIVRTVSIIKSESEEKIYEDLKNNIPVIVNIGEKEWVVNKGINYIWDDSRDRDYEVIDGHLILFNGVADDQNACMSLQWDEAFPALILWEHYEKRFPEITRIYDVVTQPFIDLSTIRTPVISFLREK